jgi:hypothetical protein
MAAVAMTASHLSADHADGPQNFRVIGSSKLGSKDHLANQAPELANQSEHDRRFGSQHLVDWPRIA